MRHFGALTALAFLLSMLADFTALPAALWLVFRAKPDAKGSDPKPLPKPEEEKDTTSSARSSEEEEASESAS
jgi:hypothetical protein